MLIANNCNQEIDDVLSGKLYPELVLWGYRNGIFPMADSDSNSIQWFYPIYRGIIELDNFHIPQTLRSTIRNKRFRLTRDQAFAHVIRSCAEREQTWINEKIIDCYTKLHKMGYAHSIEAWKGDKLAGGLYGVELGRAFFGESMFHNETDASKVALVELIQHLRGKNFSLLDIQWLTEHLTRFGATEINHFDYMMRLKKALSVKWRGNFAYHLSH